MERRKLPAGIQNFREIREGNYYYVDKTDYVQRLAADGKHYFLSRPRRFGKSLLVDTIKELFEGSEALFRGLAVHGHWDWAVQYPVLRLSFAAGTFRKPGLLAADFGDKLAALARKHDVALRATTPQGRLAELIELLAGRTSRRVVLLVDEYDRPIVDALGEPEVAAQNRDFLRGVYGVAKDCDALLRMTFFTGVSKFSKVSIFADLNNLRDITLDERFAASCGYTEKELEDVFEAELDGVDRGALRDWYNGYSWRADGGEKVYNPYGMLLFLDSRAFKPYWFETGTPRWLPEMLLERHVAPASLEGMLAGEADLSAFEVERARTEALLFQTGYLTIVGSIGQAPAMAYRLGYPNREVRGALNLGLLSAMSPNTSAALECSRLRQLLAAHDFAGVERALRAFFASIPHQWHVRNDIARYEGFYASVFYSHFAGAGLDVAVEQSGAGGRSDMVVRHDGGVCVFEFKTGGNAQAALAQIRERGYAEVHLATDRPVHLVGVAFSEEDRNIAEFAVARA